MDILEVLDHIGSIPDKLQFSNNQTWEWQCAATPHIKTHPAEKLIYLMVFSPSFVQSIKSEWVEDYKLDGLAMARPVSLRASSTLARYTYLR